MDVPQIVTSVCVVIRSWMLIEEMIYLEMEMMKYVIQVASVQMVYLVIITLHFVLDSVFLHGHLPVLQNVLLLTVEMAM
jgi:hypothetical protein